jgi:uncharacterized protein
VVLDLSVKILFMYSSLVRIVSFTTISFFLCLHAQGNSLKNHPSPYLALHGNDPVEWNDWQANTAQKARDEDRLLFFSVGYFSCHWCHVMQRESYKNPDIARFINKHYIPVKIDRELEPALDARLIEFTQNTEQRAGWPLNVFITPEGHPLFSALYMPPEKFKQVLERVNQVWQEDRNRLRYLASKINEVQISDADKLLDKDRAAQMENLFLQQARSFHDEFEGGFGSQNKFPHTPALFYLLEIAENKESLEIDEILKVTLDAMANNGLFDHVGGGFFRYSVDPSWSIPHFEKMLYDNAELARLYWLADELYPDRGYKIIAQRTFEFMSRDMSTAQGALVASFSAVDDKDIEGGYYLWDEPQLLSVLGEENSQLLKAHCYVYGTPQLAGGHHLRCSRDVMAEAAEMTISEEEAAERIADSLELLRKHREAKRVLPVDTKLLAGWNGLALSAFCAASDDQDNPQFRRTADSIKNYLTETLWRNMRLSRAMDGKNSIGSASIEDYAYVARGLWDYAVLTGNDEDFALARQVHQVGWALYRDGNGWRSTKKTLLAEAPPKELFTDSPLVSPASALSMLGLDIAKHYGDNEIVERTRQALSRGWDSIEQHAFFYASHIQAQNHLARFLEKETVIQ